MPRPNSWLQMRLASTLAKSGLSFGVSQSTNGVAAVGVGGRVDRRPCSGSQGFICLPVRGCVTSPAVAR